MNIGHREGKMVGFMKLEPDPLRPRASGLRHQVGSKRKITVVFLIMLFLGLTGCSADKKPSAQNEIEDFLKAADEANICSRDEDCALVLGKCPLPCHILVNRDKQEKIMARMNTLFLQCLQECSPPGKLACRDGRCVMENQLP